MTKRQKSILMITAFLIIVLIWTAPYFLNYAIDDSRIAVFTSPDNTRSAYLTSHGALQGQTLEFWISTSDSENNTHWLGTVDSADGPEKFRELLWSASSTLIAARCRITTISYQDPNARDSAVFTFAYDFISATDIAPPRDYNWNEQTWRLHTEKLNKLFLERGGQVSAVTEEGLDSKMKKMSFRQWFQWKNRLYKAKNSPQTY